MYGRWALGIFLAGLLAATCPASARSWADLDGDEPEIYGRDREEKLPVRLFFVQREKWEAHDALHIFWLWGYTDYPRYRSNRVFPFFYDLQSKVDNRYQLISPVYYREIDGAAKAQSFLWLAYWGENEQVGDSYHSLIPLYYWYQDSPGTRFLTTPLFWYSRKPDTRSPLASAVSIGVPIIPLILWSADSDETDLRLFYFIRDRRNSRGILSHVLPLYYYSRSGETTFASFLMPLIWMHSSPERTSWLVFPIFYTAGSPTERTTVSPLLITRTNSNGDLRVLIPIYLQYKSKDYSLHVNVSGISVSEESPSTLPIGGTLNSGKLTLDWDLGWFYNLFRVSSRHSIPLTQSATTSATNLQISASEVGAGVAPPQAGHDAPRGNEGNQDEALAETNGELKTEIGRARIRNRADSTSFFGLYFLFGVSAYERADHYRHFRLLPLSWLTWDANSDNGVQTVVPIYVHYRDEISQYLVWFPVYGHQERKMQDCMNETSAWLLLGYWHEFKCQNKIREKTILWPLINWYESPEHGGFRVFPLFWSKWRQNEKLTIRTHFSPLHHTRSDGENYRTISWLFYRERDSREQNFGVWGLLHLSDAHDATQSTTYILPVYFSRLEPQAVTQTAPDGQSVSRLKYESWLTVGGLFWNLRQDYQDGDFFHLQLSLLHLTYADKASSAFYSWLFYRSRTERHTFFGVPLIFHRDVHADSGYSNIYIFPFYHSTTTSHDKQGLFEDNVNWLFPVYYSRTTPEATTRFITGYFYERSKQYASDNFLLLAGRTSAEQTDNFSWHALFYTLAYSNDRTEKSFKFIYGIGGNYSNSESAFSWHLGLIAGYKHIASSDYVRHHLLPIWWHSRTGADTSLYLPFLLAAFTNRGDGNHIFRAVALGILYYENSDREAYEQTLGVALGALYYHNKYPERHFDSYGSLYGLLWHYETEDNYRRFSLLTFIYSRTETEQGVRHRVLGIPL